MHRTATFLPLALAAAITAQNGCLDQSHLPAALTNGLEITSSQTVTQTFTAGMAGMLATVEIANVNHHRGTPSQPLEVRVVAADGAGVPNGATLFAATFQPNQVPATRGTLSVDVRPAAIAVQPGLVLGIRLSSAAAPSTQTYAWWGEAPGASYGGGQVFLRDTTPLGAWDLSFRTFVAVAASAASYGTGHPGTAGVPALTASAAPRLGTTIDLVLGNAAGGATTAALLAGVAPANVPTPFGGTLLVQALANATVALPAGGARVAQPIPNQPGLCGRSAFFQLAHLDGGASLGIAFSAGLELRLGQ